MRRVLWILAVLFIVLGLGWLIFGDHQPRSTQSPGTAGRAPATRSAPMQGDSTLRVRVVGQQGKPIDDAEVACTPAGRPTADGVLIASAGGEEVKRRTDDRGIARFELPAGDWVVEAVAPGFLYRSGPQTRQTVHLATGGDLELELMLSRGASVSGRVSAGGEGVAARVKYRELDTGAVGQEIPTKDDGTFTIAGVPPGRVRIHAKAEGAGVTLSPAFDVDDGEHVEGIEIELSVAGSVAGKLVSESGEPVAGFVRVDDLSTEPRQVVARVDGTFEIDRLRPGSWRLVATADGFDRATADVDVEPGEQVEVQITLSDAFGVHGVIHHPERGVPEHAWALLMRGDESDAAVAAKAGRFHIEVEPPAGAQVIAVSPHHATSEARDAVSGEEIVLKLRPGGQIEGHVRTPDGEAVTQFEIGVESFEVDGPSPYSNRRVGTVSFVSSDGSYEFGPLRPGKYWLRAAAEGYAPGSAGPIEVRANGVAGPLDITLGAGAAIRGRVTNSDGEPLHRARVEVFDPFSPFAAVRVRTKEDGGYVLRGVAAGRRSIRVAARGYVTHVSSGLDVPASGEVVRDVVIEKAEDGAKFSFHGIGAVLRSEDDGAIVVAEALEDRPASIFGLKAGDRIMAIDGRSTSEIRFGTAIELIRGEEGVPVELELQRDGEGRLTVEVERGRVVVK